MKKCIAVLLILACVISMVSCCRAEGEKVAIDENALNAEEQQLVDSLINTFLKKQYDYDTPTIRIQEVGDYCDKTDENGGITVKIKVRGNYDNDTTCIFERTYFYVIKAADYEAQIAWLKKQDPKVRESLVSKLNNYGRYCLDVGEDIEAKEVACYYSETGAFIYNLSALLRDCYYYRSYKDIRNPYEGIRISKINNALKEHFESLGLL